MLKSQNAAKATLWKPKSYDITPPVASISLGVRAKNPCSTSFKEPADLLSSSSYTLSTLTSGALAPPPAARYITRKVSALYHSSWNHLLKILMANFLTSLEPLLFSGPPLIILFKSMATRHPLPLFPTFSHAGSLIFFCHTI